MEPPNTWNIFVEQSAAAFNVGQLDAAETMLRAAYKKERQANANHARMALVLENLAAVYIKRGRYSKAERLYARALSIYSRARTKGARSAARICFKMAHLYLLNERIVSFKKWYEKALAISALAEDMPQEERAIFMLMLVRYLHERKNYELGWSIYKQVMAMRLDLEPTPDSLTVADMQGVSEMLDLSEAVKKQKAKNTESKKQVRAKSINSENK